MLITYLNGHIIFHSDLNCQKLVIPNRLLMDHKKDVKIQKMNVKQN